MCLSKIKPRLREEWIVVREQSYILDSCCLSPIRRNSVLEDLRVRRLAVIREEICCKAFCKWLMLEWKFDGWKERKSCVSSAYRCCFKKRNETRALSGVVFMRAIIPHFCHDKCEIWHGKRLGRSPVPNFTFTFWVNEIQACEKMVSLTLLSSEVISRTKMTRPGKLPGFWTDFLSAVHLMDCKLVLVRHLFCLTFGGLKGKWPQTRNLRK